MGLLTKLWLIITLLEGGDKLMVDVYVALIVRHRRTINDVPEALRPAVSLELTELGLDGNGDPIPPTPTI